MVVGLGVDIIQNNRIESIVKKWGNKFLYKVFTDYELAFIEKHNQKTQRYASNYAAKEAVAKALGTGFRNGIRFRNIELKRDNLGKPFIELAGTTKTFADDRGISKIHTTISHEKDYSVAVVIFED